MNTEILVKFLHNLAMATWVGGMIFLAFLKIEVEKLGPTFSIVIVKASKMFTRLAVTAIVVLILTGIMLTFFHGGAARVQRDWILNVKHILVTLVILNGFFLGFKVTPALEKLTPGKDQKPSAEFLKWKKWMAIGAHLNLLLGILIVLFATL